MLGVRQNEIVALCREDISALEAWVIVAPRLLTYNTLLLPISVASSPEPLLQKGRRSLLREGRIAVDTAWEFRARAPDGKTQITFWLAGNGALAWKRQRITVFELDANGERIPTRAMPNDWLDSPEVWNIARGQSAFRAAPQQDLSSVSLQLLEYFQKRRWCWVTRCFFGDGRRGAEVEIVLDAISGEVLLDKITRYSDGMPISTSIPG